MKVLHLFHQNVCYKKSLCILLLSFSFLFSNNTLKAQATYDNNGKRIGNGTNFIVPEGANRLLVVFAGTLGDVRSVKFNGQSFTRINARSPGNWNGTSTLLVLKLGSGCAIPGVFEVDVNGPPARALWAGSFQHVNQTTPIGPRGTQLQPGGTPVSTIGGLTNDATMDMLIDGITIGRNGPTPNPAALGGGTVVFTAGFGANRQRSSVRIRRGGGNRLSWRVARGFDKPHVGMVIKGVTKTTVTPDTEAPTPACVTSFNLQLDANGNGRISGNNIDNGSTDNCGAVLFELSKDRFTCSDVGSNPVTLTVKDGVGNSSSCNSTVNVQDNVNPVARCQSKTIQLDASGNGSLTADQIDNGSSDACGIKSRSLSKSNFTCNDVGFTTVTLTITDNNDNVDDCTASVFVRDFIAPNAVCQNVTVQLAANGNGSTTAEAVNNGSNDACGIKSLSLNKTNFTCSDVGANTVTLRVVDNNNRVATCTATVTVSGRSAPSAVCQNVTVQLDANGNGSTTAQAVNIGSFDDCGIKSLSLNTTDFTCGDVGNNTVTLSVSDFEDNISTCTATVMVEDNIAPKAICQNLTVQLDANGNGSTTAQAVNNGSNDACGIKNLSLDNTSFTCSDVGNNTVTLTVTDNNDKTATCTSTVTVEDNIAPTALCKSTTVQLDANGAGSITAADLNNGSSDNCGIKSLELDFYDFECGLIGEENRIILTVTDNNDKTATCEGIVIVEDNIAPTALCKTVTVQIDANGQGTLSAREANNGSSDACGIKSLSLNKTTVTCADQSVVLTVIDNNNNHNSCTANLVFDDNIAPKPDVKKLPEITAECSATVTKPTATDNCAGTIEATTNDPLTYSTQGIFNIVWTYDDGNGNSITQSQTVIINDVSKPVPDVSSLPTITEECSASVSPPTATDNCEGTITAKTNDPTSFSVQGNYTINWIYDDGNGNVEKQSQDVIIKDVSKPIPDLTNLPTIKGECSATIADVPTATDNCNGSTIFGTTNDPLTYFTQGTHIVTWSFDDGNGNIETQTQTLIVDDVTKPVPDVPVLPIATGECSATVSTTPTATDNCEGKITGTTNDPLTYTTQGTHIITWSFDDGNGNVETQTQTVIVDDVTKPVPDQNSLPVLSAECSVIVSQTPTATDNCEGTIIGTTTDPLSYSSQGTHLITWTFDDGNGNIETQTQTVIINDVTAPVPDVTTLPTLNGNCEVGLEPPFATDNCVGQVIGTTSDPLYFDKEGTYTVTWVYDDGNGNTSSQVQTIIIEDDIAPVPDRNNLPTLRAQCGLTVSTKPTATDRCVGRIVGTTSDPLTYNTQGTFIITWTFDDGNGNAVMQTQRVIIRDNQAPVPDQSALPTLTGSCSVMVTHFPTATDNCAGSVTATTDQPLEYNQEGTYAILWKYDDGNGNTSIQSQWVIVGGNVAPNARCKDISVPLGSAEKVSINASDIDNGSFDDCSSVTLLISPAGSSIFGNSLPATPSMDIYCKDGKVQNLLLSVSNEKGNTAYCRAKVSLQGPDKDSDGLIDSCDNCRDTYNPDQKDDNNNGKGDACEENTNPDPSPGGWGGWSLKKQGQEDNNIVTELKAFPNPFQEEINLSFNLSQEERTTVEIFNIHGQRVHTLLSEVAPKGEHRVLWDGRDQNGQAMPAGIYLIRLRAGKALINQKVVLQR